jgi:hypothetical protein
MLSVGRTARRLRSESGFSLIEVMVAMVTGLIVVAALFAILEVSLHQASLITDKVQANQGARLTMNKVVDALHSACFAQGVTPIQEKSTGSDMIFWNAYSEKAEIPVATASPSDGVYKHELQLTGSRLIDSYHPSESVTEWPTKIVFNTSVVSTKTSVIGEQIQKGFEEVKSPVTGKVEQKSVPVFQYWEYSEKPSAANANAPVLTLTKIPLAEGVGLTAAQAAEVAAVTVTFAHLPGDGNTAHNRSVVLSTPVTLAFGSPATENPIVDKPCE